MFSGRVDCLPPCLLPSMTLLLTSTVFLYRSGLFTLCILAWFSSRPRFVTPPFSFFEPAVERFEPLLF